MLRSLPLENQGQVSCRVPPSCFHCFFGSWLLGFLACRLLVFLACQFLGFLACRFLGFLACRFLGFSAACWFTRLFLAFWLWLFASWAFPVPLWRLFGFCTLSLGFWLWLPASSALSGKCSLLLCMYICNPCNQCTYVCMYALLRTS